MRTPILAAVLGLALVGCLVGDSGDPGTGDDGSGSNPGSGSDPGSGSGSNPVATPKLDVTVDKPTISTELLSTNMVTVSLQASGGFSGAVNLAATAVDGAGTAIPGWTVALDKSTVDVAANGAATVVASVKVPSDSVATTGTVKIDATSSLGTTSMTSSVSVAKQLTVNLTLNNGNCVYPAAMVGTVKVSNGTKIRWVNGAAADNITIHITAPQVAGLNHEQGATAPGGAYEQTVAGSTGKTDWYCHNLNNPNNMFLQAVP
jgi:hypothetical protein